MEFHKLSNGGELFLDRKLFKCLFLLLFLFINTNSATARVKLFEIKEPSFYIIPGCVYFRKTIKHSAWNEVGA